jgi:hypothetical protein
MTIYLPDDKVQNTLMECQSVLQKNPLKVKHLASLIGKLTSSILAVVPAPLHYRHLQMLCSKGLIEGQNYENEICLNGDSKREIQWWMTSLKNTNGRCFAGKSQEIQITTDASDKGWGAWSKNRKIGGFWLPQEKIWHINAKELKAAFLAIKTLTNLLRDTEITLFMDNMTAVSQVNKKSSPSSPLLLTIVTELWEFCIKRHNTVIAVYLPGALNVIADQLSRTYKDPSDWKLDTHVFQEIQSKMGTIMWDLFASRTNKQLLPARKWTQTRQP